MIKEKIKNFIGEQLGINPSEISDDANIVEDLGADSLDIAELLMTLEDEYGILIPEEKINDMKTISKIEEIISTLVEEQ
ncbi:MAG: acyl carrier protein [Clostridia bacterium]|nr:acyl carrier protein [Clostridia bacterium]